jgi:phosphonate degradation associated HDIG domain protein
MNAGSVDEVVELFERYGADRYDEEVTQLEHALQSAALASDEGAPDELVAAALLHDVGHLLELADGRELPPERDADLRHERLGARWLADVFPPEVTAPIALHVRAKRYRCAVDPAYHDTLSPGSRLSLARQGGPLDPDDVPGFEANPGFEPAVRLRGWDDRAKVVGLDVPGLDAYVGLLARVSTTKAT